MTIFQVPARCLRAANQYSCIKSRIVSSPKLNVSCRFFHQSPKHRGPLLDACCTQSFEIINAIHGSTGLSWVYVLPITAILIRSTIVLPLSFWSRVNERRLMEIRPLIIAWVPRIQRKVMKENSHLGPVACEKLAKLEHRQKQSRIFKDFGITRWAAFAPLLQLPVFLLAIETIRRMSGIQSGLLGWIASKIEGVETASNIPIQTSLSSEGALWFQDLLVPDPQLILPVVLSSLLFSNVTIHFRNTGVRPSKTSVMWNRVMKLLAIAIIPVTLQMPAGILVYWTSSAAFGLLSNFAMDFFVPIKPSPTACKPMIKSYLRMPGRKQT
jgi:mitochondrial inner membrane protein COX18